MRYTVRTLGAPMMLLSLLTVAVVLLSGCAAQAQSAAGAPQATGSLALSPEAATTSQAAGPLALRSEERTSEGGGVTVKVKPAGVLGGQLLFDVVLDTHSVDLAYELAALASLKDEQGRAYRAAGWQGGKGGHHVSGVLTVEAPGDAVKSLELELRDIGGVASRTFRWDVR